MKYKWIGITGTSKAFGYVENGKEPDLINSSMSNNAKLFIINYGLEEGLLELVEDNKKTKKAVKIKED